MNARVSAIASRRSTSISSAVAVPALSAACACAIRAGGGRSGDGPFVRISSITSSIDPARRDGADHRPRARTPARDLPALRGEVSVEVPNQVDLIVAAGVDRPATPVLAIGVLVGEAQGLGAPVGALKRHVEPILLPRVDSELGAAAPDARDVELDDLADGLPGRNEAPDGPWKSCGAGRR